MAKKGEEDTSSLLSDDDLSSKNWLRPDMYSEVYEEEHRKKNISPESLAPFVCIVLLFLFSGVLFLAGVFLPDEVSRIKMEDIKKDLVIDSKDTKAYKRWVSSAHEDSVPMYFNFYPFNITNVDEVLKGGKPNLKQYGPYVFRKYQVRFNVTFPDNGERYRYQEWTYFKPDLEMSSGDPAKDKFITVNLPFVIVQANLGQEWYSSILFDLLTSKVSSDLFTELTVNEMAFGYNSSLLEEVSKLKKGILSRFPGIQPNQTSLEEASKQFGFDEKKSGKNNFQEIGQYTLWQGNSSLDVWGSEWANTINGTEGYQFKDHLKEGDIVSIFVSTTVRNLQAQTTEKVKYLGIPLLRFRVVLEDLMNAKEFPKNAGYYQFGPSGVINRTSTAFGAPLFLSLPHFLHADPSYRNGVIGMHPNITLHGTTLDVEPETGTTMNAQERLQINIVISPDILRYPNIKETYVPILWIEQNSSITPHLANQFKEKMKEANDFSLSSKIIGFGFGSFILCFAVSWILCILLKAQFSNCMESDEDVNE